VTAPRIIDLDDYGPETTDPAIITLQLLVAMHSEPHRRWKVTPSDGGAWNYEKSYP
jgi:hypothetical protein